MKKLFKKYDVQIGSAIALLAFGMILTVWSFVIDPAGIVEDSVLNVFARCLMFAGSMLGVGAYVNARFGELDNKINHQSKRKEELA